MFGRRRAFTESPKIVCAQPGGIAGGRDANGNTISINGNAQIATDGKRQGSESAMRRGGEAAVGLMLIAIAVPLTSARAAADSAVGAAPCSVAAGRDASNNTLNCNFGLTPEQFKQLTDSVVKGAAEALGKGATEAAVDVATKAQQEQIDKISKTLGVTEDAAKTLLKIVGEDPNIPDDKLAEALSKVAGDYQATAGAGRGAEPGQSDGACLVEQAKPEIDGRAFPARP